MADAGRRSCRRRAGCGGGIVRDGNPGAKTIAVRIHPSAVIDKRAELDTSVEVGPGAVIGPGVKIGAGTVIGPSAMIERNTTIGARNRICQFAATGPDPQSLKSKAHPLLADIAPVN